MILILGVRELRSESKNVSLLLTSPCSLTSFFASPEVHTSSPVPSRLKPGHTVKGFGMVNKAEIDVFLELSK